MALSSSADSTATPPSTLAQLEELALGERSPAECLQFRPMGVSAASAIPIVYGVADGTYSPAEGHDLLLHAAECLP